MENEIRTTFAAEVKRLALVKMVENPHSMCHVFAHIAHLLDFPSLDRLLHWHPIDAPDPRIQTQVVQLMNDTQHCDHMKMGGIAVLAGMTPNLQVVDAWHIAYLLSHLMSLYMQRNCWGVNVMQLAHACVNSIVCQHDVQMQPVGQAVMLASLLGCTHGFSQQLMFLS